MQQEYCCYTSMVAATDLKCSISICPSEPLWKRAPTRDEQGHLLSDFMMIIKGLSQRPVRYQQDVIRRLENVMAAYRQSVLFVDLNMKLNILWVSLRSRPAIGREISAMIQRAVPEALLVSHKLNIE